MEADSGNMKLKNRLLTGFIIITALPILLMLLSAGAIVKYQVNSIQETYDVEYGTWQILANPAQILNRLTRGVHNEILVTTLKEPERLEDLSYIDSLNKELLGKYSFIALRRNADFTYIGNKARFDNIKETLPKFGEYNHTLEGGFFVDSKNPYLLKQQDFYFADESEGSIFIITDLSNIVPQIKSSVIQIIWSILGVILVTAMVLVIWIYQSVLRPLNTLHAATYAMQQGNLDFSIKGDPDDEIGRLCIDFEEMRIRLKHLIEVRLKYEADMKELISNISHDLKTPVTAIKGYAEGIMDGVADTDEKLEKYLRTIYTKAGDVSLLVDELSFYSKIDCDTVPYGFKQINIDDYFCDCIEELTLDLEMKNIKIAYKNNLDKSIKVEADAEQLKRVVNNIIGNSVKYMDKENGLITIAIEETSTKQKDKEYIKISISDNGEGVKEKELNLIFERFYRADESRNSQTGGSGLGLAIAKKIIEDHGGTIGAKEIEEGGLMVYFTLLKSTRI